MTDTPALEVRDLCKTFDKPAVDRLDLSIEAGRFYALLGPNGAGKTTTLRMVAGLLEPDRGSIRIFGNDTASDPLAAKQITAWVPDEPLIYDKLTPNEYLSFVASLWRTEPARAQAYGEELLDILGLRQVARKRCETLSKGMRQKVALAGALIHQPRLIILDEPLTGLDAASARRVKSVLKEQVEFGATVVMTTHILEVAERMAETIGIIHHGRLIEEGDLRGLKSHAGDETANLEEAFLKLVGQEELPA